MAIRRWVIALLGAVGGYFVAALLGYALTDLLSSNTHDRAVEAAMTAAFVWGPLGSISGFIVCFFASGRGRAGTHDAQPK